MTLYGVPYASDGLGNLEIGKQAGRKVGIRSRCTHTGVLNSISVYLKAGVGYSLGTGGTVRCDVYADDGAGAPTGSSLANASVTPGNVTVVGVFTFGSPPSITNGTLYHYVFTNTDGSPTANYTSLDDLDLSDMSTSPLQPALPDIDQAIEWQDTAPPWVVNLGHYPIYNLAFADGFNGGQAYFDAQSGSGQRSIGTANNAVRLNFTPTATLSLSNVFVRLYKQSGTTRDLTVILKQGSTTLDTQVIPIASIHQGNTGSGYGARWASATFTTPQTITIGVQYSLEMWSVLETTQPYIAFPIQAGNGSGSSFGLPFKALNTFADGFFEYTTNAGALWSKHNGFTDYKAQVYFTVAPPAVFTPPFTPKAWQDYSTGGTPITAAALVDLETRVTAYTDSAFGSTGISITSGTGSPEGVITGTQGDLYLRKDGSTSTTLYVKTSGTGNVGWTSK